MATLNFVRGELKGRAGVFVGSSWRGKAYIKTFTPPGNPRTVNQVAVRSVFRQVGHIAKQINHDVLRPYTFPKPQNLTAINQMIKINRQMFIDKVFEYEKLKIFDGSLENPGLLAVEITDFNTADEKLLFNWDGTAGNPNDIAICVLIDTRTGKILHGMEKRAEEFCGFKTDILRPLDPTSLHGYLVFAQPPTEGTNETGQVSMTAYKTATVAP